MKRLSLMFAVIAWLLAMPLCLRAEVKVEEKNQVKFEGMMGRMMGLFGGKAAKEGTINTVAVKGNRKATMTDTTGEIIDLDEQKVYSIDFKKKSYEVVTFDEMRRRMQEAQEKAAQSMKDEKPQSDGQKQMEIEFSLKESGQKRAINGYDCREVVMSIVAHEKGKTLEQAGGMIMTSHLWLAPVVKEMKEIADFDMRYYKMLMGGAGMVGSMEQMATALAMYPGMKEMMAKMQAENVNMKGTAILTETIMETARTKEQMAQESQRNESSDASPIRGIGGLFGKKLGGKKEEPSGPQGRAKVFTSNHELLKITPGVSATDLSIPAGFKQKN